MEVVWRKRALNDLARFHKWLGTVEGAEPDRTTLRIRAATSLLARDVDIGRPGAKPGTRELSLRLPPDVIVYRRHATLVEILAVYHTAQIR